MVKMMLPYAASYGAWSIVTAVVLGFLTLATLLTVSRKHKNLPPGPRGLPVIGTLHLLGKHPQWTLAKLAERYGPLMSIWLGSTPALVASSPAVAEEILKTQGPNFSDRPKTYFAETILPHGIGSASDSPARLHVKKILHMQLSTTRQIQLTENVRTEEIGHMLRTIPQDGATVVPVRTYIGLVVTNVLSRMILKKRFMAVTNAAGDEQDEGELEQVRNFKEIADEITDHVEGINSADFLPFLTWIDFQGVRRSLRKLRVRMDAFMSTIISEHVAQRKSGLPYVKDMADVLLDQLEDESLQFEITDAHIENTLWDAFAAGTSTTTTTIEWAIAECICNPNVMKIAQEELDTIIGKSRRVEDADIPNLKYLQAIIKETFRLHPIAPLLVPHASTNACKVFGYDVPRGTTVIVNIGAISRDPSIWKDPMVFNPERFLDGMPHANTNVKSGQFEFLPFGSGRRACPGMTLATTMVHILTATFLQSFDWSLPNDLQPTELNRSEAEGIVHILAHPLTAIPKARLSISSTLN